ncbi:LexA-binding, inner membrane-associated putative hydrolase [Amycolatopsis arida]|uniref:LexA-binding, inner membrane-associated putative hydrolase n=1 Tax=Amycolatopsis arida TaxID=587909 RepID=A0A1I5QY18_9PSEU|nr:metal-dependent hydrolase [Amycolatopsis arida]TDX99006.1 LexA-binding, inner membrane-associated putative hydrolase [Amycolatopsis arida]SFP51142.1 LexA-binding, inner membrane-associated putative hydrolase [Amycolatopsis arida]
MMGRTHALTGWCVGLALAPAIGAGTLAQAVVLAATTAGFALLPDLDHPGARASRLLGPITGALSWLLRRASGALYQVTKGPRDERRTGTHRHLSHTVLFAAALGGATALGTSAGGPWAVAGVVLLGLLLAEDALGDWLLPVGGAGVVWWVYETGPTALDQLDAVSGWLGVAVAAGCVTHCLGDALTESGCPFLFPVPIAGETWYEIRPPRWLRFRTGKAVENLVVFPACGVLALLLLPGVWDFVLNTATLVFTDTEVTAQP